MTWTPDRIVVAGDWHGDTRFATAVIGMLPDLLPAESPRLILHCGDFGIWPGRSGAKYLRAVSDALEAVNGELWFVDGNHEDHERLQAALDGHPPGSRIRLADCVHWLSRGHRWTWHGRIWLALGGATSVDRPIRTAGLDWWPGEALTTVDREFASAEPADVIMCHDCPSSVPLRLPLPPLWWELEPAARHREALQRVVDAVKPSWLIHGHYHLEHDITVSMGHRPVRVTGLASNEELSGNFRVLDVRDMTWCPPSA